MTKINPEDYFTSIKSEDNGSNFDNQWKEFHQIFFGKKDKTKIVK